MRDDPIQLRGTGKLVPSMSPTGEKLIYVGGVDISRRSGRSVNEREFLSHLLNTDILDALYIGPQPAHPENMPDLPPEKVLMQKPLRRRSILSGIRFQLFVLVQLLKLYRKHGRRIVLLVRPSHLSLPPVLFKLLFRVRYLSRVCGLAHDAIPALKDIPGPIKRAALLMHTLSILSSDRIWTVTDKIRSFLEKRFHIDASKFALIPNGVNTALFNPWSKVQLDKTLLDRIPHAACCISYCGSFRYSGLDYLIRAVGKCRKSGLDTILLIAGAGDEGEEDYLRGLVEEEGLEAAVLFLGWIPYTQLPGLYRLSHILAAPFPLRWVEVYGSSSQKLFQYLASGKPILTSSTADHRFIEEQGFGKTVVCEDVDALAACIKELAVSLAHERPGEPERRFHYAQEHFSFENMIHRLKVQVEEVVRA